MSKRKKQRNASKHRAVVSAQQTIPYIAMHPDGVCQLPGGVYTKTLEYDDINYAVASTEDQSAIFSGWSACLNYFDSSLPFQLSFVNRRSRNASRYKVNIPEQEDDFNSIRGEFVDMLKGQIAKSNNGIERYKYITFGLPAESAAEARPRLGRVEADVMGNLKRLGVQSRPLDGRDRLGVLHGQMHPGGREPFRFAWRDIPKTGMGTKDFIAPDSFDLRQSRTFRVGQMWGAASYLQIMASELSDKLLAEILELDAELTVTMHIQTVDQLKAIKTIKGKISDIGRMKAIPKTEIVNTRYRAKMEERQALLKGIKTDYAKATAELDMLRAEVIKSIRGESAFSQELLGSLVKDAETKCLEVQQQLEAAQQAYEDGQAMLAHLNTQYDDIVSWAEMYDTASMEAKKMIINCLIKRVDVYRDYKLHIDFNIDFEQFSAGLDIVTIAA